MTRASAAAFLAKSQEYLASALDNLAAQRFSVAAGDAIHAGISAKDAIVTALTGTTGKSKDHALAIQELRRALGQREDAAPAERALKELLAAKSVVEYGSAPVPEVKATALVRRARSLYDLGVEVVRLSR